ncbi:MAG: RNB domain-containing ribonuclease [Spirochaetaceae bacterium]|nr:RNB domain-containing ribonuclease [Spirochaetaceae bacterium]
MIREKSLAVYKNRPVIVAEIGEKITITLSGGETLRVREKDIEPIHPGPCTFGELDQAEPVGDVKAAWELLEGSVVDLKELAALVYDAYTPRTAWATYRLLKDGLYFSGEQDAIQSRSSAEVAQGEQKRQERRQEQEEREAFLERLKTQTLRLPEDGRFLQDVEALAYGRTEKSRTLKEAGKSETPQEAHRLLLNTGFWTYHINPHPARFGLAVSSGKIPVPPAPEEERLDLTRLGAFAIDNAWSGDPDDAISAEGDCIWVHVADPAASVTPGSPADVDARGRGATLYLPEGASRMLPDEVLPLFALGLSETSPALSFKMRLHEDCTIKETEIVRSWVKVTRLTYEEADLQLDLIPELKQLCSFAERNLKRRLHGGAIAIELPEIHIFRADGQVKVEPVRAYRSTSVVRECMLLAGEGAGLWALQRRLPFPYIAQEAGELPQDVLKGFAGSYQLRRCMRPRTLSAKPGIHWGLGLDAYTQVTSPLRRYTDLLAHQQIRAFLRGESPLGEEEVLLRLGAGEAAASGVSQAERASRDHWLAAYLSDKKGSQWQGVALEKRGPRTLVLIPDLGLETQVSVRGKIEPNESITLTLGSVKIPEGEAVFIVP